MKAMKLKILGVRGSRPTHKTGLLGYGGHSTSFEFLLPDESFYLFLDGGSGIAARPCPELNSAQPAEYYFLITHTHWDHILGFPFFRPLYSENSKVTFVASQTSRATFHELFFGLHCAQNLPVPPDVLLKAKTEFRSIRPGESLLLGSCVTVRTFQINHQGVTLAYRLAYGKDSVAVVTDNAPIENNYMGETMKEQAAKDPLMFEKTFNDGLIEFLRDCHTVVFDTHFTEENLKADWGHSTPQRALNFCVQAGVRRLILFHHAPEDLDKDVDRKLESVRDKGAKKGIEVVAAVEGEEWTLR